jgi:hypothetical protein
MKYLKYFFLILLLFSIAIPAKPILDGTTPKNVTANNAYTLKSRVSQTPYHTDSSPNEKIAIRSKIIISNPIMTTIIAELPD